MTTPMITTTRKQRSAPFRSPFGAPSDRREWLLFWLAGPGKQKWPEWSHQRMHRVVAHTGRLLGNMASDNAARTRVLSLFEKMTAINDIITKRLCLRDRDLLWQVRKDVNESLRRYPSVPYLCAGRYGWAWTESPIHRRVLTQELYAIWDVQTMSRRGWPSALRRCAICNNWFWSEKSWSKYCNNRGCKRRAKQLYQTSEAYRVKRRKNYAGEIMRSNGYLSRKGELT